MVLFGDYNVDLEPVYCSDTSVVVKAVDRLLPKRVYDKGVRRKKTGMNAKEFFAAMEILVLASSELPPFMRNTKGPQRLTWGEQFDILTKDCDAISSDAFTKYCDETLGPLTVAIKFMSEQTAHDKEVRLRQVANLSVLPMLPSDVSSIRTASGSSSFLRNDKTPIDLALYPYAIVMPFAQMTLADLVSTETMAGKVRYLGELAEALSAFHKEHMVHGDVTSFDAVFVHDKLYVIDGDASAVIGRDHLGFKFSSVLPPEMFYELNQNEADAIMAYWDDRDDAHRSRVVTRTASVAVKAWCPTKGTNGLPYSPVRASQKADSWAFGCLMFKVLTDEDLVPVTIRGTVDPDHVQRAASWTADAIRDRVSNRVREPHAVALLVGLLDPDPDFRFSLQKVVKDPFFTGAVSPTDLEHLLQRALDNSHALKEKADEVLEQARRNNRQLLATIAEIEAAVVTLKNTIFTAVLEASDVQVPSSYLVLPQKLRATADDVEAARTTTDNFLAYLTTMGGEFLSALSSTSATANVLKKMAGGRPMYLYLVDEMTGLPVLPADNDTVYPIELVADSTQYIEFMTTCMPAIQSSFQLLQQGNNIARLLSWFGVPSIDKDIVDLTQDVIKKMTCTPVVFAAQLNAPPGMETEEAVKAVRGAGLRMLDGFLKAEDPNQWFCGLARGSDDATGQAVWTTMARVNQLQSGMSFAEVQRMALAEEAAKTAADQTTLDPRIVQTAVTRPLLETAVVVAPSSSRRGKKEEDCDVFLERMGGDIQKSCVSLCSIM